MENLEELKSEVIKLLITSHNFDTDEAEEVVETSCAQKPELWSEKSVASDLANFLASDEADE